MEKKGARKTGKSGGRGNCNGDVIYEKRMKINKTKFKKERKLTNKMSTSEQTDRQ